MDNLNEEIHQKNATISKIEGEIVKRNAIIERKQSTIDQYNKRIDQMRNKDGVCTCTLGPLSLGYARGAVILGNLFYNLSRNFVALKK